MTAARERFWSAVAWTLLEAVTVFGALGWLYVAMIAVYVPDTTPHALTTWMPVRRDTFGIVCFASSAAAHVAIGLRKKPEGGGDG